MFDDCKGDIVLKTLSAFSTVTLHKVLASDAITTRSVAGRLFLAERIDPDEGSLLLPLAIAHRTSLNSSLRRRRILRARYRDFGNAMANKDLDLERKFEKIVETQEFLDENPPSESTVDRVSKVLDQQWQGNRSFLDVIAQGEEHKMGDVLLDREFEIAWRRASIGEFDGDISTTQFGLLEDLERRVASQQARLEHWKGFKESLKRKEVTQCVISTSPSKSTHISPKSLQYEQRKEKELVFSPRKSTRKSMLPVTGVIPEVTEDTNNEITEEDSTNSPMTLRSSPLAAKSKETPQPISVYTVVRDSFDEEHGDSSFSEISANEFDQPQSTFSSKFRNSDTNPVHHKKPVTPLADTGPFVSPIGSAAKTVHAPQNSNGEVDSAFTKLNEDELLARQLVSTALDATLTPMKKGLSLVERTRHSIAVASPDKVMPQNVLPSLVPHVPSSDEASPAKNLPTATLAERTRQSISLVPARPKRSRDSMHIRRASKNFPTNQFETPKRQSEIRKLTPPEELMSPKAGYDSVFKSRPKIALSPTTSPCPEYRSSGGLETFDHEVKGMDY